MCHPCEWRRLEKRHLGKWCVCRPGGHHFPGWQGGRRTISSPAHAKGMAEATVARLYEGYSRQLYRYCLKHLRSHEDAEDAVQNTFLRVHAALGKGVVPEFES